MPPRTPKKLPPGPGTRRGVRGGRGARTQAQVQPEVEEPTKAEDAQVNEVAEEKASPPAKTTKEQSVEKKDDDLKESIDEFEKSERLDLEDNDPEYEPEEYAISVDYGEKEIEPEEAREEGDEIEDEEEEEEDPVEEEESDMIGEEVEDLREELEGEEDNDGHELRGVIVEHDEDVDHHELVKERRKRKEFEVFVGGLDKDATEDDLRKVFGKVGDVVEVRLMMNPQTKKNKGFAFLRFATIEQAKRACSDLKNPVVHGKPCGVTPSQDSDTLFLGNICRSWTKEALRDKLRHYAIDNIEDLTLVEDSNSIGMNRGFAFLEFSSRPEAMDAFKRLQKRDVFFGVDRPAKVSFADSFIDPGDEIMAQVKTVFVDGLLVSWDEDHVRGLLKKYGEVEKVELARNMPSAKRKDFGFVTFNTHEAAVTCAKSINNEELGEGDRKAKVRARLSRPLQRGKGKNVGRGEFRAGHGPSHVSVHGLRTPWSRTIAHSIPVRGARGVPTRVPPTIDRGLKRPSSSYRDRRPIMAVPPRSRPPPPPPRSYERRPPVASYPKSSMKRDYGRHEELPPPRSRASIDYSSRAPPPRSRASIDYSSRAPPDRRASFRDDYSSRESGYPDLPRVPSRPVVRRDYVDDAYAPRYERPPPAYREARGHEYEPVSGSKRPYSSMDDVPPRYADAGPRQSRARMDYELSGSASYYGDDYGNRPGRSNLGYGSGRSTIPSQDSSPLYGVRQGMSYGGGSYSGSDGGGMYSSGFGGDYMHRDSDGGGSSYSSTYPGRGNGWWVDGHGR